MGNKERQPSSITTNDTGLVFGSEAARKKHTELLVQAEVHLLKAVLATTTTLALIPFIPLVHDYTFVGGGSVFAIEAIRQFTIYAIRSHQAKMVEQVDELLPGMEKGELLADVDDNPQVSSEL